MLAIHLSMGKCTRVCVYKNKVLLYSSAHRLSRVINHISGQQYYYHFWIQAGNFPPTRPFLSFRTIIVHV